MGHNIFVSYKFADDSVRQISKMKKTTVRDYVDLLETKLSDSGHIYYGEHRGEDLSDLNDEQIYEHLKDKIYPTSVTVVLISPEMRGSKSDKQQWIPWEISYSLRETTREARMSRRNGVLAVVLPDVSGSYEYALERRYCCASGCTIYHYNWLFDILRNNMFNIRQSTVQVCQQRSNIWTGEFSYIPMITWDAFINDIDSSIARVEEIRQRADEYKIQVLV